MTTSYELKVILVGEGSVGKTTFAKSLVAGRLFSNTTTTIGLDIIKFKTTLNNKKFSIALWDTAGQESYRTFTKSYYRGSDAVLLFFDVSNKISFYRIIFWLGEISVHLDDAIIMLIGTKIDAENRQVTKEDVEVFIKSIPEIYPKIVEYIEISSYKMQNLHEVIENVCWYFDEYVKSNKTIPNLKNDKNDKIVYLHKEETKENKKCPC